MKINKLIFFWIFCNSIIYCSSAQNSAAKNAKEFIAKLDCDENQGQYSFCLELHTKPQENMQPNSQRIGKIHVTYNPTQQIATVDELDVTQQYRNQGYSKHLIGIAGKIFFETELVKKCGVKKIQFDSMAYLGDVGAQEKLDAQYIKMGAQVIKRLPHMNKTLMIMPVDAAKKLCKLTE